MTSPPTLEDAAALLDAADRLLEPALTAAQQITEAGKRIDDHQLLTERVAYAVTEGRAARELLDFTHACRD